VFCVCVCVCVCVCNLSPLYRVSKVGPIIGVGAWLEGGWEALYRSACASLPSTFSTSPVFYHCPTLNLHSCYWYCLFPARSKRDAAFARMFMAVNCQFARYQNREAVFRKLCMCQCSQICAELYFAVLPLVDTDFIKDPSELKRYNAWVMPCMSVLWFFSLFWDFTHRRLVVRYRRCGTHLQESSRPGRILTEPWRWVPQRRNKLPINAA